jgi:hypothetical protein
VSRALAAATASGADELRSAEPLASSAPRIALGVSPKGGAAQPIEGRDVAKAGIRRDIRDPPRACVAEQRERPLQAPLDHARGVNERLDSSSTRCR